MTWQINAIFVIFAIFALMIVTFWVIYLVRLKSQKITLENENIPEGRWIRFNKGIDAGVNAEIISPEKVLSPSTAIYKLRTPEGRIFNRLIYFKELRLADSSQATKHKQQFEYELDAVMDSTKIGLLTEDYAEEAKNAGGVTYGERTVADRRVGGRELVRASEEINYYKERGLEAIRTVESAIDERIRQIDNALSKANRATTEPRK